MYLVRSLLQDKKYTTVKKADPRAKYDNEVEVDGYKFLGAYLGKMTGLQFAIMLGQDDVAKDIIDATLKDDLDATFGVSHFTWIYRYIDFFSRKKSNKPIVKNEILQ